ncbi:MAG: spermidine synthase [Rhodospirillaceae bacterium]
MTVRSYRDGTRNYELKGGNQGSTDAQGVSLEIYIHALYGLALQRAQKILIIGCASGSLATMLARAGRDVTLVDIDPAAFKLAQRYFHLAPEVACHVGDGLAFLRKSRVKYDALILDAFIGEAIPDHFTGATFYESARKCVKRAGMVLVNVCLHDRKDPLADEIARGFKARGWPVKLLDEPGTARNALVLAGDIAGLRKPGVTLPPGAGAAKLRKGVAAMKFRAPTTARS